MAGWNLGLLMIRLAVHRRHRISIFSGAAQLAPRVKLLAMGGGAAYS